MHKIAILAHPDVALFELACAVELFALPRPEFDNWYEAHVVAFENTPITTDGGMHIRVQQISSLAAYDTVIVPSWSSSNPSVPAKLMRELHQHYARQGRILSFCSGAFLLAEMGLLAGRETTTHWKYADTFKQRYPELNYIENVLYTFDGQIGCSAGSSAAIDLGIELIRHDFGYEAANSVARRLVMSPHRQGGQSQFVETPVIKTNDQFATALDWAVKNLNKSISVDELAAEANMSRRSFDRKFKAAMGVSAKQWLIKKRLEHSKALLEQDKLSIKQIASASGFETDLTFRHHFKAKLGITPKQYQNCFAHK